MSAPRKITAVEETSGEPPSAQDAQDGEPREKMVIRVRRGALRRFDQLKAKSADLPVEITWDRRAAERRSPTGTPEGERRLAERRQKPPYTWNVADFLVVGDSSSRSAQDQQSPATPRKKRPG